MLVTISGYEKNKQGLALCGIRIEAYDNTFSGTALSSTTTNSSGYWNFTLLSYVTGPIHIKKYYPNEIKWEIANDRKNYVNKKPIYQRIVGIAAAAAASVHAPIALLVTPQTVTTLITNPDKYRALSITGNAGGEVGNVTITGTSWAGEVITDTIALAGAATINGVKPFLTVTSILVPALTNPGDTVSIGCCDKLGFYRNISAASDIVEVERRAAAAVNYSIEATGAISTTYMTILQAAAIIAGDSIGLSYLTIDKD